MLIKTFSAIDFPENCYAVRADSDIFLVDPGEYTSELEAYIKANALKIKYIFLTHMHFDHIRATARIKKQCPNAKIVIHISEALALNDPSKNLSAYFGFEVEEIVADVLCKDLDIIKMGEVEVQVLHTPGHTEGGVCFIVDDILFSGDTLFEGSCGRTDFPGGDSIVLANSLKRLKNLEGDYRVFPGHGNNTTLNCERLFNPFMRSL